MHTLQAHPLMMKKLIQHAQRYYWMRNNYYLSFVLRPEHFIEEFIKIAKQNNQLKRQLTRALKQQRQQYAYNLERKKALLRRYNASAYLRNLIYTADLFTYVQDIRKQGVLRLNHFLFLFCDELARRCQISREEALYTVQPEIKDILLKKKVNRVTLQERLQKCFIYFDKRGYKIIAGKKAEQIPSELFYDDYGIVNEIRGTGACIGEVTGIVRVVHNHEGIIAFKEGEILVTNNTTPEFVPALKKAKAVITEQGGITTHAAIISREFGIPCIVGTKIATKVLKDGDVVLVDATKGLVRKLG
ncbi:hypothetical protein HYW21_05185 [Candidatus Woesearchaeota archaeon]|nr:hypothetical protein [Candidatus Woesearchaeota archaeon]